VTGLVTAARRDRELAAAFGPLVDTPLGLIREVLERAVGRGEVPPGRDLGLIAETALAVNVFRMLVRDEPPDRGFVRRVVDEILYPLLTAPVAARAPGARSRPTPPRAPSRRQGGTHS